MRIQGQRKRSALMILSVVAALGGSVFAQPRSGHRHGEDPTALTMSAREERQLRRLLPRPRFDQLLAARGRFLRAEREYGGLRNALEGLIREENRSQVVLRDSGRRLADAINILRSLEARFQPIARESERLQAELRSLDQEIVLVDRTHRYFLEMGGPEPVPLAAYQRRSEDWRRRASLLDALLMELRDPQGCVGLIDDARRRLEGLRAQRGAVGVQLRRHERDSLRLRRDIDDAQRRVSEERGALDRCRTRLDGLRRSRRSLDTRIEAKRLARNQLCEEWNRQLLSARSFRPPVAHPRPPLPHPGPLLDPRVPKVRSDFSAFVAAIAQTNPREAARMRSAPLIERVPRGGEKVSRGDFKKWVGKHVKKLPRFGPIRPLKSAAGKALKRMKRTRHDISHFEHDPAGAFHFFLRVGDRTMIAMRFIPGDARVYRDILKP